MMLRPFYRCVVRLHPPAFRNQFGDEMLSIFDHAQGRLAGLSLVLDGVVSLGRQWGLRPEFWREMSSVSAPEPALDGTPSFYSIDPFRLRAAAFVPGLVLSVAVLSLMSFAIQYSAIHGLSVRGPQFETSRWIPPTVIPTDARREAPQVSRDQAPAAPKTASVAERPSAPALPAPAPRPLSNTPAKVTSAPTATQNAAVQSAAPNAELQEIAIASPESKAQNASLEAVVATEIPSAIADDSKLDVAARRRVIEGAVTNLEQYYVYPEVARKMANALRAHEKNGDNNAARDGKTFAHLLTRQLQDVSHDQHVMVAYNPAESSQGTLGSTPEELARYRREMDRTNCTFEKAAILEHNIGYLKFNSFPDPSLCQPNAAAAMARLNQADAIIFDLRDNKGGSPSMVALMASYLFEHPTHLDDLYNRSEDSTLQSWTLSPVPGNKLALKPAYVLTSASTFSGAEEFAYDLKLLQRATVVGEKTAGAAYMARRHRIDDHFSIGVPETRPINPISHTDWEGTGVTPDVSVKADDALKTAEALAEKKVQKK